ncbi:RNA polymerase II transcription elongation factor-domain-containing protein [Pyrenochaeta sp. MPI-SDFR-AT-0127]|nr:RNA polymerase II transcription elongation factor-domain-containing protein [Pyrenochaeta sp. MPI-SDFR-AT-0127]
MASPVLESRVEPHRKAQFSLHISDRIAKNDASVGDYSSVKYNHKPAQTSDKRTAKLTSSSTKTYKLRLEDSNASGDKSDIFTFTGQKSEPKKSYVLVFDPSSQQATLEPLSKSYTFNLATKNSKDVSTQYSKIYPKKPKEGSQGKDDEDDLFGEAAGGDEAGDPDPDNPYDFRHFLSKEKEKRGDESEYHFASSPDYRTGTGSAANTPQFGARQPAAAPQPKANLPAPKKRKTATPNPMISKPRKTQPPPAVRLERRASERPPPAAAPKTKKFIHSSDESDVDADGDAASSPAPVHQSRSPARHQPSDDDEDDDAEGESDDEGGLEIEETDAHPVRRGNGALASLGLGQNLGVGYLKSPSHGPISLASATSSVAGSPNPNAFENHRNRSTQDEIDFGDLGGDDGEGEEEDEDDYHNRDIEPMDLGPPARQGTSGHDRKASMAGVALDDDEDDLEKMMMAGLVDGDSSEESEEE